MKKKPNIDPAYYENNCFADDFVEAKKNGMLGKTRPGESALEAIERHMKEKKKTAVSVRLPLYVVNTAKAQAKKVGVPYTSYICAVLEKAIAKPQRRMA